MRAGSRRPGALALRRGRPSTADLQLAISPGAILTEGTINGSARIVDAGGGPRATLNLIARSAALRGASGLRFAQATISADGPLERLPLVIDGRGSYGVESLALQGQRASSPSASGNTGLALDGSGRFGTRGVPHAGDRTDRLRRRAALRRPQARCRRRQGDDHAANGR
jgi:translocation and assembly module TamB